MAFETAGEFVERFIVPLKVRPKRGRYTREMQEQDRADVIQYIEFWFPKRVRQEVMDDGKEYNVMEVQLRFGAENRDKEKKDERMTVGRWPAVRNDVGQIMCAPYPGGDLYEVKCPRCGEWVEAVKMARPDAGSGGGRGLCVECRRKEGRTVWQRPRSRDWVWGRKPEMRLPTKKADGA